MKPTVVEALLALNRTFYERFAGDFARTRRSSPPGFDRIVPYLLEAGNVVDLGCGNGRLLLFLHQRGWRGNYVGLDSSGPLLEEARRTAEGARVAAAFAQTDLLQGEWPVGGIGFTAGDTIVALAVLHHIPWIENRQRLVSQAASILPPGGRLILSAWQFMTSDRLRKRLLPWSAAGLSEDDLEPGDYLMGWGAGGAGQRYVAMIGREQLTGLAERAGLSPVEMFTMDGFERDLNLYAVLGKRSRP